MYPGQGHPLPTSRQLARLHVPWLAKADAGGVTPSAASCRPVPAHARGSRAGAPTLPGHLSNNQPLSPLPHAPSLPMHPACPPAPSLRGYLPATPRLRRGTVGTRAHARHLLLAHYNPPLEPWRCQPGFFKQLTCESSAKNSFQAAQKLENLFLFTLYELQEEARLPTGTAVRGAEGIHWLGCCHVGPSPRPAAAQPSVAFTP